jgi:hypothetical protein
LYTFDSDLGVYGLYTIDKKVVSVFVTCVFSCAASISSPYHPSLQVGITENLVAFIEVASSAFLETHKIGTGLTAFVYSDAVSRSFSKRPVSSRQVHSRVCQLSLGNPLFP